MKLPRLLAGCLALAWLFGCPLSAQSGPFDSSPVWPLCGRITENKPRKWKPQNGCPQDRWGNPDATDAPLSSTYGPRQLVSEGYRYDFHRGLDVATPIGTPLFAFADGVVQTAGPHPSYTDPLIRLRHYRPGSGGSCTAGGGCYNSLYLHVSGWTVAEGEAVSKGQLIGYTGASDSGFEHVHFEIRDAPAQDPFSSWQRDAIHPLRALPYPDNGTTNIELTVDQLDLSDPLHPYLEITARVALPIELDLDGVEAEVCQRQSDGSFTPIVQPGDTPVGNTIEGDGYLVDPSWYSVDTWNRQYSYKDSSAIPWSSFLAGGAYESPYAAILPSSYDPQVHLDAQDPSDFQVGLFNGMSFAPSHTNASSSHYVVRFGFRALVGGPDAADLCVRARAFDVRGNQTPWVGGSCEGAAPPVITSTPVTAATEGVPYSYDADATGATGWSLDAGPAGLAIDGSSGLVSWAAPEAGSHEVAIRASNAYGDDTQTWQLVVDPAGAFCGDTVCGQGESCDGRRGTLTCPADCPGRTNGKPSGRYCWVEGACEGPGC